jgi:VWFA-related protein
VKDVKRVKGVKAVKGVKVVKVVKAVGVFTSFMFFTSFIVLATSQQQTFRTRTDIVHLDISVLDNDRKPVRGLTAEDFTVFEDGKPQQIAIFEAIDVPDPEPPPVEWMRDVTPDVTTNETRVTRLWVIAIDDALIPQDPYAIQSTRKIVTGIIDKFSEDDLVAIVFTGDSRRAQDFTNDRSRLLATLDKFNPGLARWKGGNSQDPQFWLGAANTLRHLMDALVTMPNSRKALIWVSPGAPMNVFATISDEVHLRLKDLTTETFDIARRANVPVYPIDPLGLFGLKAYITDGDFALEDKPEAPWVRAMDHLMMTAANTGGRPVVHTNDFTPGIDAIFEENKSYYLIGYHPTNAAPDGKLRRLEVKVKREDVNVRTRDSYVAPKPGDKPPANTNATLARATESAVPVRDLPLRATAIPFAKPDGRTAAVVIALGVRQPVPETAARERVTVTTELRTSAFTTEGGHRGSQRHTAKVVLRAGAQGDADYEALARIDLAPGRYRLRLAAHQPDLGRTGTVMVDVLVPDFFRDAASTSGVAITADPGRPSAPRDLFRDVLPIVPTAQRAFSNAAIATALSYLYQHAGRPMHPATVEIRITDGIGAVLITDSRTLAVDQFKAADAPTSGTQRPIVGGVRGAGPGSLRTTSSSPLRAAELRYALPLDRLPAGPYLLTFEATVGEAVLRRDVQFEVR